MPIPSPFHERTAPLCRSWRWKDWAGYCAVCSFDTSHAPEYFAFRHAAGLLDVSPLYKIDLRGPDAATLLGRLTVRRFDRLKVGRVAYCCWCDDRGHVIDDGTVTRLDDEHYRLTSAGPSFRHLSRIGARLDVEIVDTSRQIAALALQGPTSRDILEAACDTELASLSFFGARRARPGGVDAWITRTGYTGDLGYEVWVDQADALPLWDALVDAGRSWGLTPAGLDALDMTRIEAGFILYGVDYFSATSEVLERRRSTPWELGLGWMVQLDRGPFVGRDALRSSKESPAWKLVGLELDWGEIEQLYAAENLPAALPAHASREPLPVYLGDEQVGQATSHTWSPLLKKPLALASVRPDHAAVGTPLAIEHTVEFERRTVTARVTETPFFDPERKRS